MSESRTDTRLRYTGRTPRKRWTKDDDKLLIHLYRELGPKYDLIQNSFPSRDVNEIKVELHRLEPIIHDKEEDEEEEFEINDEKNEESGEQSNEDGRETKSIDETFPHLSTSSSVPQRRNDILDAKPMCLEQFQVLNLSPDTKYKIFQTLIGYPIAVPLAFQDYIFIRFLENGTYSVVILYQKKSTGKLFAIKFISKELLKQMGVDTIQSELLIQYANHPNVIKYNQFINFPDSYAIVTKYYPNGDFLKFVQKRINSVHPDTLHCFIVQMANAIYSIHSIGITNGDIKLENFLMDKKYNIIMADFSHAQSNSHRIHFIYGSEPYRSPEFKYTSDPDRYKVDIYEFGSTLNYIVMSNTKLNNPDLQDLIDKCKDNDPNKRPTIIDILNHPYIIGH